MECLSSMDSMEFHGTHEIPWFTWNPWNSMDSMESMESMELHGIHGIQRLFQRDWAPYILKMIGPHAFFKMMGSHLSSKYENQNFQCGVTPVSKRRWGPHTLHNAVGPHHLKNCMGHLHVKMNETLSP